MTETWFLNDIEHQLKRRKKAVIVDPEQQCRFLLPLLLNQRYTVLETDSSLNERWQTVKEELYLRKQLESDYNNAPVIIYTTREKSQLSFLFDYCYTHGCLDLSNPTEWIRKKLFASTGLQVQMEPGLLLTAAKLGVGKDLNWWKKIVQEPGLLVEPDEILLPFLHDPVQFLEEKESDVRQLFESKFFELMGQPYMQKSPGVIAREMVKILFDGLANNEVDPLLLKVYHQWADSDKYRPSLENYINGYTIASGQNPWVAHPDHCFVQIDILALRKLTANLSDKKWVKDKAGQIKVRAGRQMVTRFVPAWWKHVITLLEFDTHRLAECNSLQQVVDFYTAHFAGADRAIRMLYSAFLHDEPIIKPLQEYYESLNYELLQKWFSHFNEYKQQQQGWLVNLFAKAGKGTAVIVADGLRYEIACTVAGKLGKNYAVTQNTMLADMPSDTENNMSALFVGNHQVLAKSDERQKKLSEATGKTITWMKLEALNYGINTPYLGLMYGDIDKTAETLQMGAVKLFEELERVLTEKIDLLLKIGYKEVHLVTDHGFVLTGLIAEADKIEGNATGKKEVHERFIRTVEKQSNSEWIEFKRPYGEYKYVYAAKNHRPFKTRGEYGFSHGGCTPQELIVPQFVFRKQVTAISGLEVIIDNTKELSQVEGEIFAIQLRAAVKAPDLFNASRKVMLKLYAGGAEISASQVITMLPAKTTSLEFSFAGNKEVQVVLVDATTFEQLDSVIIKKSSARDLGGLL